MRTSPASRRCIAQLRISTPRCCNTGERVEVVDRRTVAWPAGGVRRLALPRVDFEGLAFDRREPNLEPNAHCGCDVRKLANGEVCTAGLDIRNVWRGDAESTCYFSLGQTRLYS